MAQIAVEVAGQYFVFKRFIDLLAGSVAKTLYIKPHAKQEGLVLEHMKDVVEYTSRLETIYDSVGKIEKNLAAAFETLSRRATAAQEMPEPVIKARQAAHKHVSKFGDSTPEPPEQVHEDLADFDELPQGAVAGPKKEKVGIVDWDDL